MTRNQKITSWIIIWSTIVLMACNLGTTNQPPTLVPRATATPQATLGYAMPESTTLPGDSGAALPPADIELYNLLNQVESDRLLLHVDSLQNLNTRHVNSTGVTAAAQYISDQFETIRAASEGRLYTFTHEFELTYQDMTTIQYNVGAVIQGTEEGAGTIIVGAHYDSIGQPLEDPTTFAPGANDNGTGVSSLIELARIMSQRQYRASIMFVAFSAEEVGRRGSIAFVDWLQERNIDVMAMLNVDTIGNYHSFSGDINDAELRLFSAGPNDSSPSRHLARTVNFITFNHAVDIELTVQDAIDRENRYGDHFSFSESGYAAVRFIQANEEKRNGDPTDTIEFIEPGYFRRAVQSLLTTLVTMADGPRPPRNITLRDQGNGISELRWEPIAGASSYIVALRWPGSLIYNQQFETTDTVVEWDNFSRYAGIAIAARDASGMIGPLSPEYRVAPLVTQQQ